MPLAATYAHTCLMASVLVPLLVDSTLWLCSVYTSTPPGNDAVEAHIVALMNDWYQIS